MSLFESQASQITNQLERLTTKDRVLVLILVVASLAIVGTLFTYFTNKTLLAKKEENEEIKQKLEQILQLQGQFQKSKTKIAKLEKTIRENPVQLLSFLSEISKKTNVELQSIDNEVSPDKKSKISNITTEVKRVSMREVPMSNLIQFLDAVEGSGKTIKIQELRLQQNFKDPTKPDVVANIATYVLK